MYYSTVTNTYPLSLLVLFWTLWLVLVFFAPIVKSVKLSGSIWPRSILLLCLL